MSPDARSLSTRPVSSVKITSSRAIGGGLKPINAYEAGTKLRVEPRQIRQLRYLAEMSYPFEACGMLVGKTHSQRISVSRVLQAGNLSENGKLDRYVLDPEDFLTAERCAREQQMEIVGIWHSHPNHPAEPSTKDLEAAWHGYSYVIVSVDALGDTVVRSWRLRGSRLVAEPIEVVPTDVRANVEKTRTDDKLRS